MGALTVELSAQRLKELEESQIHRATNPKPSYGRAENVIVKEAPHRSRTVAALMRVAASRITEMSHQD